MNALRNKANITSASIATILRLTRATPLIGPNTIIIATSKMINLIVKDGLGNQMFQYAFARLLVENYRVAGINEAISIITYYIDNHRDNHNDERSLSLNHLNLAPDVSIMPDFQQAHAMRRFTLRCIRATGLAECFRWRVLRRYNNTDALALRRGRHGIYYPYGPYTDNAITLSSQRDKYVFGFFQAIANVEPVAQQLHDELCVKTPPSPKNVLMLQQIQSCQSVCLHIRRGDYLNEQWKHLQLCDFDYYNRAINYILDNVENPVFFVFSNSSDDLDWIRDNYHFSDHRNGREVQLVYVNLNNPDYEELRLMYSCSHFIISNSTFSWWGAWLSSNEDKIVCAPRRWNLKYDDDYKIYDPSWIKM